MTMPFEDLSENIPLTEGNATVRNSNLSNLALENMTDFNTGLSKAEPTDIPTFSASGFNGELKRTDGLSYEVHGSQIYDRSRKLIGHINQQGQVTMAGHLEPVDINSEFKDFVFTGNEDGHKRIFECSAHMASGTIYIPEGDGSNQLTVQMGMLIDKRSGEQLGLIKAPHETANGGMEGGSIILSQEGKSLAEVPLAEIKNAVFDLTVLGESAEHSRQVKGISLGRRELNADGTARTGTGGYFNVQSFIDAERDTESASNKQANELRASWFGSAKELKAAESKARTAHAWQVTVDSMMSGKKFDPAVLNEMQSAAESARAPEKGGAQSAEAQREKQGAIPSVELPSINAENVCQINGRLRISNELYQVENGLLFRRQFNAGTYIQDKEPSGSLGPDYFVHLKERNFSLADEPRVIFEFSVGRNPEVHQILGLGTGRQTEGFGWQSGGLVSIENYLRKSLDTRNKAEEGNVAYFTSRPYLTGALTNWVLGDREALLKEFARQMEKEDAAVKKQIGELFTKGLNEPTKFFNTDIDGASKIIERNMVNMGWTGAKFSHLAEDAQHMQEMVADSTAMAATTVLTAGLGSVVSAAVEAERMTQLAALGVEASGGFIFGGTATSLLRRSDNSNDLRNFACGGIEGSTMALGMGGSRIFAEIAQARKLGTAAKLAYRVGDAGFQTTGFTLASLVRDAGTQNSKDLALGDLAAGTVWMLAGQLLAHGSMKFAGRASEAFAGVNPTEEAAAKLERQNELSIWKNRWEMKEGGIGLKAIHDTVMAYTNSGLAAMKNSTQQEETLAKHEGREFSYYNVLSSMNSAGCTGMITAPFLTLLTHPAVETSRNYFRAKTDHPEKLFYERSEQQASWAEPELRPVFLAERGLLIDDGSLRPSRDDLVLKPHDARLQKPASNEKPVSQVLSEILVAAERDIFSMRIKEAVAELGKHSDKQAALEALRKLSTDGGKAAPFALDQLLKVSSEKQDAALAARLWQDGSVAKWWLAKDCNGAQAFRASASDPDSGIDLQQLLRQAMAQLAGHKDLQAKLAFEVACQYKPQHEFGSEKVDLKNRSSYPAELRREALEYLMATGADSLPRQLQQICFDDDPQIRSFAKEVSDLYYDMEAKKPLQTGVSRLHKGSSIEILADGINNLDWSEQGKDIPERYKAYIKNNASHRAELDRFFQESSKVVAEFEPLIRVTPNEVNREIVKEVRVLLSEHPDLLQRYNELLGEQDKLDSERRFFDEVLSQRVADIQKQADRLTTSLGLPKAEITAECSNNSDGVYWTGSGKLALNESLLLGTNKAEYLLADTTAHELDHHEQSDLIVRRILDGFNADGSPLGPNQRLEARRTFYKITGCQLNDDFLIAVAEARAGDKLEQADRKRADDLIFSQQDKQQSLYDDLDIQVAKDRIKNYLSDPMPLQAPDADQVAAFFKPMSPPKKIQELLRQVTNEQDFLNKMMLEQELNSCLQEELKNQLVVLREREYKAYATRPHEVSAHEVGARAAAILSAKSGNHAN